MSALAGLIDHKPTQQLWTNEALFWLHIAVIFGGLCMGFVLPLQVVVAIVGLHRLHLHIFNGCILSKFQTKQGGLDSQDDFMYKMMQRLFGLELDKKGVKLFDYLFSYGSLGIASIIYFFGTVATIGYCMFIGICIWGIHATKRIIQDKKKSKPGVCFLDGACNRVKSSRFSKIAGISVETLGLIYFMLNIFIELVQLVLPNLTLLSLIQTSLLISGLVFSLFFIMVQRVVLKEMCVLCMNVHGASLFLVGFAALRLLA